MIKNVGHAGPTGGLVDADATVQAGAIGENELEVLAGFIVWLTRQDIPGPRGSEYHGHVERYLRWRARPCTSPPTASEYMLATARGSEVERQVRASFALLSRYLLAASVRREGSVNPLWSRLPSELAR